MRTVTQQLVTSTKNVSTNPNERRTVTIHETGNESATAGAQAHANLQSRPNPRVASWHYQVDWQLIIQSFLHIIRTFHAGTARGNREGISIEICVNSRSKFRQAVANAAWLTAKILRDEGLPISAVIQHNGYSGKNCPTHLRSGDWGVTWSDFLAMVRAELNTNTNPNPTSKEDEETMKIYSISNGGGYWLVDYSKGAQRHLSDEDLKVLRRFKIGENVGEVSRGEHDRLGSILNSLKATK